jgi:hydrogenase maturation protease
MTSDRPRYIVIGVGNPDRGDDAAGPTVVRDLRNGVIAGPAPVIRSADIEIVEHSGEAATLVMQMDGAERVFLIDACVSGAPPGTIHRFDVDSAAMPTLVSAFSTHGFGLATAVELARALGQLPRRCIIYAIEGAAFEPGAPLSPPVAAAAVKVVHRLRAEIAGDVRQEPHAVEDGSRFRHFAG